VVTQIHGSLDRDPQGGLRGLCDLASQFPGTNQLARLLINASALSDARFQ
jgi:hypothetical protein